MNTVNLPPGSFPDLSVVTMTTVSKTIAGQYLNAPASAANADQLGEGRVGETPIAAIGGWDAYDVWRKFIKEARDRRKGESDG